MCVLLNNAYGLHLSQRGGQAEGRTIHQRIHRTTECFQGGVRAILRGSVLRKALVITYRSESAFVPSCTRFYCETGRDHICYQVKSANVMRELFGIVQTVDIYFFVFVFFMGAHIRGCSMGVGAT